MVDATKVRIGEDEAWAMLQSARTVHIARGKKYETYDPAEDDREVILAKAMGPSGNLRAPTFKVGRDYVIGFNPDLYEEWVT